MESVPSFPRLEPFRAWRYRVSCPADLSPLITPPYDVISPERRNQLAAANTRSFVHLILPRAHGTHEAYDVAAATFRTWRQDGTLVRDTVLGFTLHSQTYALESGAKRTRTGLLGLISLDASSRALVRPHEKTLSAPLKDRTALMRSVGAHLSPIFLLAPDPEGALEALLHEAAAVESAPDQAVFTDGEGVRHQVQILQDPGLPVRLQRILAEVPFLIADGHHRFESAVAIHQACRQKSNAPAPTALDTGRLLVEVVSLASPGLTILPIHRLIKGLSDFDPERILSRLQARSQMTRLEGVEVAELESRVLAGETGTFGLILAGCRDPFLIRIPCRPSPADPLACLDVTLLHREILASGLGIGEDMVEQGGMVSFTRRWDEAARAVASRESQIAFILAPPSLKELEQVTGAGLTMPQKSTYFHPKLPAGLVIHSFD
ncbi:MAG: DUF1015 domain-containing protein [Acidobacteriota bacterium]